MSGELEVKYFYNGKLCEGVCLDRLHQHHFSALSDICLVTVLNNEGLKKGDRIVIVIEGNKDEL